MCSRHCKEDRRVSVPIFPQQTPSRKKKSSRKKSGKLWWACSSISYLACSKQDLFHCSRSLLTNCQRFRNRSGTKEPLILQLTLFFLREKEGGRGKNLFYCIIIGEGPKWGELLSRGRTKRDWTGLLGGKKNRTRNPHKSFIFGNFPFFI